MTTRRPIPEHVVRGIAPGTIGINLFVHPNGQVASLNLYGLGPAVRLNVKLGTVPVNS